ncbi:hypothetical protein KIN20_025056 [Parelaphostrongylus tenuis]|uniref:Uncharacterized protein n=1 Tax=Parelaphostrongylus tenuis TaxID=148309 RepID=A0AAD5MXX3_PARTN|nr:hypothetical protein KIN20_025056 [Parelaphostrongylus tenuis]
MMFRARVSDIATSEAGARGFVTRLVMQTVFDVLELQARSALLPDAIILTILDQLNVAINYEPLNCQKVVFDVTMMINHEHYHCELVRTMWQSVLNRAIRMLASGPFGSHFLSATATVDGN